MLMIKWNNWDIAVSSHHDNNLRTQLTSWGLHRCAHHSGVLTVSPYFFFDPKGNPNFTVHLLTGPDALFRIFLPQFPFCKMEIILALPYRTVRLLRQVNAESTSRTTLWKPAQGFADTSVSLWELSAFCQTQCAKPFSSTLCLLSFPWLRFSLSWRLFDLYTVLVLSAWQTPPRFSSFR